jgi:hypothetical protein
MPGVIENKICKGTNHLNAVLGSGMTSLQVMVASATSVSRVRTEARTFLYLVPWPSSPTYRVKTQDSIHIVSHH